MARLTTTQLKSLFGRFWNDAYRGSSPRQEDWNNIIDSFVVKGENQVGVGSGDEYTTIQAAINAVSGDASISNQKVVLVSPGVYTETLTLANWVHVIGPGAAVTGNVTLQPEQGVLMLHQLVGTMTKNAGATDTSFIFIDEMTVPAASFGLLNLQPTGCAVFVSIGQLYVSANGIGIGNITTSTGHIHVFIGDIYLTGNSAIGIGAGGLVIADVQHILEVGTPTTTIGTISALATGDLQLTFGRIIADTAIQVNVNSQTIATGVELQGTVTNNGTMRLFYTNMKTGANQGAAGAAAGEFWINTSDNGVEVGV